ncbi:MAG: hypothetical protein ACYC99_17150, partial [Candidatus Geothermincolia bacterium]
GYLLGFLIPLASSGNPGMGRVVFFPIGGAVSLFLGISAIVIGLKVRKTLARLPELQRKRAAAIFDIGRQNSLAGAGIALGILSIIVNPLIAFLLISMLK